jgi:DNA-binding SARP family transcriptional activator
MSNLQIRLFGKFTVQRQTELLKGLEANKERELLSYLLIHRNQSHPREALASLLWGETTTEKSKKYLRQALWRIQSAFETDHDKGEHLLVVEHDWVQLNLHRDVWLDVEVFERASAATQGVRGRQLDSSDAALLHDAVTLYKSDLLDGWYQDWCLFERERLQNMYLCMLDKLMSYCEAHADYEAGQRYGAMILRYDRASERTHRRLMHLQYNGGDRTGALRQYQRCVAALNDELGVKPEARTKKLYELIRNDSLHPQDADNKPSATETPVALPEVLSRLKRLQLVLAALQKRVGRDVKAVEQGIETMRH